jgi:signal recognition particle subunit SRP54
MFDALTARLQQIFRTLRGEIRLTPAVVEAALGDIRLALLEADVHYKVVSSFLARVRARALDAELLASLTPFQQIVRIVRDEMIALVGPGPGGLGPTAARPRVVLLVGLQGSGKTTTAAKLARWFQRQGRYPLLVSTDVRRPAGLEQLAVLGRQGDLPVYGSEATDPVARAAAALTAARHRGFDVLVVDTAGRLHVDETLMRELEALKAAVDPTDVLYVADAMTGQDAVRSAGEFHRRVGLTGVILTKLDGDARGGAALSIVAVVGVPIVFVGEGERLDDLEVFHGDRLVSRILGMGDVLSLVERAERALGADGPAERERRRRDELTLEDLRDQIRALRRMGPLDRVWELLPGWARGAPPESLDARQLARVEAIICAMTPEERRRPETIDGSRRRRIARGSGTTVEEVNRLLRQFREMRRMVRLVGGLTAGRRGRRALGLLNHLGGGRS